MLMSFRVQLAATCTFLVSVATAAAPDEQSASEAGKELEAHGFKPAVYFLFYKEKVLDDKEDARIRSDGLVAAVGSKSSTQFGLEYNYRFPIVAKRVGPAGSRAKNSGWTHSWGWNVGPYIGVFDLQNRFNGTTIGVTTEYWRGDPDFKKTSSFNLGIGAFTHRSRIALSSGVTEGAQPPQNLAPADLTTKKDVTGWLIMVSAAVSF